jgi:hypothetical protein
MKTRFPWFAAAALVSLISSGVGADDTMKPAAAASSAPATSAEAVPAGSVELMKAVLCSGVQDREPGPEITSAKVGDIVVGWTQVRSGIGETTIVHRWLHEADNMGDVSLAVKGSPWRTWSRKTVSEPGNWKWQVLDSSGSVLKEVAFNVSAEAAAPPAAQSQPATH